MAIVRKLISAAADIWLGIIQNMPGPVGYRLRYRYWRRRLKHLGSGTRIDCGVYLQSPHCISIGANCWIDRGAMILAGPDHTARQRRTVEVRALARKNEVQVGNNVHIGPYSIVCGVDSGVFIGDDCGLAAGARVYAFSHHYRFHDRPSDSTCAFGSSIAPERQSLITGPITLERNVGVALGAILLPGVWIGADSFVSAHAVVLSGSFSENSVIAGSPARRIAPRFTGRRVVLEAEPREIVRTD